MSDQKPDRRSDRTGDGWSAGGARRDDDRPSAARPAGGRDGRPRTDRPRSDRSDADRSGGDRSGSGRPAGDRPGGARSGSDRGGAGRPWKDRAGSDRGGSGAARDDRAGRPVGDRDRGRPSSGGDRRPSSPRSDASGGHDDRRPASSSGGSERYGRSEDRRGSSAGGRDDRPRRDDGPRREDRGTADDRPRRDDRLSRDDRPRRDDRGSDRGGDRRPVGPRADRDRPRRPSHEGGDVARGPRRDDARRDGPGDRAGRDDRSPRTGPRDDHGPRTGSRDDRGRTPGPRNAGPPRGRVGPGRPPAVDPARQAAYELLTAVRERDAYANLALPGILRRHRLRDRDAALATELGYGTLRAQGLLDAVIDACTDRALSKIEHPLLDALRLGAYQLLRTRVPAHAAVDTCVELVRGDAGSRSAGFVNAVLRRIGEKDEAAWLEQLAPDPAQDPVGSAALRHAHPRWIAQAFADALGTTGEELVEALAADDTRPVVHLLARPGEISAEELALATGGEPAPYSPYGVHLEAGTGDVGELAPVSEGMAIVQDEGSQLAALALARAELLGEDGGRWLDLCAGPGGKSALLGGLVAVNGGTLDAVEHSEHRAELVRKAVVDLPVTVHTADGREAPLPDGGFDRVLVDAPCTGLGALRRRPEARWRRSPDDVSALTKLQRELLLAALRHVRPGGVVAYVTCSPHLSETVGVLAKALRRGTELAEVERLDVRRYLPEQIPALGEGPTVQLWPHRHGTDAMFVSLLRRPAE